MTIPAFLGTVPRGTVVKISIVVPRLNGGMSDGFAWTVHAETSVAELRTRIDSELMPRFYDQFLPAE